MHSVSELLLVCVQGTGQDRSVVEEVRMNTN